MSNFNKISGQRGTLLVEAIAMLGLIALVTPTLYKKSAERLQEIQDINTASQARTMYSIIETFMKTNYSLLIEKTSSSAGQTVAIGYEDGGTSCDADVGAECFEKGYSTFVPFGFTPGDLKNYGSPKIYVHRDKEALVAYIFFPAVSSSEIGKKRAARVASLVGANGGVVSQPLTGGSSSSEVYGTGGAWRLDATQIDTINIPNEFAENSLVVTSPEPVNMSNMDSDKFLYRVPPDNDGKDYHNTMVTDLYLGGNEDHESNWQSRADEYFSIFNVRKLTLNTNCARRDVAESSRTHSGEDNYCNPNVADLYIGKPNGKYLGVNDFSKGIDGNTGAAWIYGNLSALKENFRLFREGDTGVDRETGFDVMEFSRRGSTVTAEDGTIINNDYIVFRAENANESSRVSMVNNFVQVLENGSSNTYELKIGNSSVSDDSYMRAYMEGSTHILALNSPSDFLGSITEENLVTQINRHGGTVYINGGSSDAKMDTYINDAGGKLLAGKSGSWIDAANLGNSAEVYLLDGADRAEGTDKRRFFVGGTGENSSGTMLYGNARRVSLRGGLLRVHSDVGDLDASPTGGWDILTSIRSSETHLGLVDPETLPASLTGETAILSRYTDILGSTYMGTAEMSSSEVGDPIYSRGGWTLGVTGNAWFDDLLFARETWVNKSGMKELHAGFSSYADYAANPHAGWLDVYNDRFIVRDRGRSGLADGSDDEESVMIYADSSEIILRDLEGASLKMAQGTARLGNEENYIFADSSGTTDGAMNVVGSTLANIYTDDSSTAGVVNLQKDALQIFGQPDGVENYNNRIEARAQEFMIQTTGEGQDSSTAQFYATKDEIRTRYVNFSVENNESSAVFRVMPNVGTTGSSDANVQVHGSLHVNNNKVIHVASDPLNRAGIEGENHAMLEVDPQYVQIWASNDGSSFASRLNVPEGDPYYAMLKVNPADISGGSSAISDTENASVYIRRGAIELEPSAEGLFPEAAADQGVGYIKANRLVSDTGLPVPAPATVGGSGGHEGRATAYDQYMVNPAYTSVMHDIKLTTRGGARLSDALPDFVLKGVYNLVNNCAEGTHSGICNESGFGSWASPYIGLVPYASCPPGYRNMATVVPISFSMGQAGQLIEASGGNGWQVNPHPRQAQILAEAQNNGKQIAYPTLVEAEGYTMNSLWSEPGGFGYDFGTSTVTESHVQGWFQGFKAAYDDTSKSSTTSDAQTNAGSNNPYENFHPWHYIEDKEGAGNVTSWPVVAEALYFQQNTWLKTSVEPGDDGWGAYMGFIYDTGVWGEGGDTSNIRSNYNEQGYNEDLGGELLSGYAWNVFPIPTNTIEGHATVYCYFDRSNFTSWGNLVDQRDARSLLKGESFNRMGKDSDYSSRLDDPSLKYKDPW